MKALAIFVGVLIAALGLVGIVAPGVLMTIGIHSVTPVGLYVVAALRVAIGLVLLGAASASRTPKTLRVFGIVVLAAGLATPLVGLERTHAIMNWWLTPGLMVVRLWAVLALTFGSFLIHAVVSPRRVA